jgi:hypothetical protein
MQRGDILSRSGRRPLSCGQQDTKVLMFHEIFSNKIWYKEDFIAAKPRAHLFKGMLNMIRRIVKKGVWPYPEYLTTYVNPNTEVASFPGMTQALINFLHR